MEDRFTYLLINIGAVLVPFIFSFHPKLRFNRQHTAFIKAATIVSALFIAWDILFTYLGVWRFNERYVSGLYVFNLPLEEILFFVCIPYASVFTYHCFTIFFKPLNDVHTRSFSIILLIGLLVGAAVGFPKFYTVASFSLLAVLIFYTAFVVRARWLSIFYLMFLVIMIPFFIVNGLLTGTGLEEPVVIYNNAENLGFRILTVPFEDIFYGMSLLLLNTFLYEHFKK